MHAQPIRAPHLGVWSPLPPATDMEAAKPAPMPCLIRVQLDAMREEARARYAALVRRHPDVWHW